MNHDQRIFKYLYKIIEISLINENNISAECSPSPIYFNLLHGIRASVTPDTNFETIGLFSKFSIHSIDGEYTIKRPQLEHIAKAKLLQKFNVAQDLIDVSITAVVNRSMGIALFSYAKCHTPGDLYYPKLFDKHDLSVQYMLPLSNGVHVFRKTSTKKRWNKSAINRDIYCNEHGMLLRYFNDSALIEESKELYAKSMAVFV